MDKRFKFWVLISLALFLINGVITSWLFPPKPKPVAQKDPKAAAKLDEIKPEKPKPEAPAEESQKEGAVAEEPAEKPAEVAVEPQWITLGSADPASPYRMLVTLTNVGAAVERIELNSPRYRDLDDRSGYLGHLALEDIPKLGGARVRAVGPGTPADVAGIQVGDAIVGFEQATVTSGQQLSSLLQTTKPSHTITVTVNRDGEKKKLTATLARRPLEVVRPERATKRLDFVVPGKHDPYSVLLTLQTLDDKSLKAPEAGGIGQELAGLDLWTGTWEVAKATDDEVVFRKTLEDSGLELVKRFHLAKAKNQDSRDDPSYHLDVDVSIRNASDKDHTVAYQLDGPTGLPAEGAWYATKVSRTWGTAGLRDVIMRFGSKDPAEATTTVIANNESEIYGQEALTYTAVDAQYFSVALIPQKKTAEDLWFSEVRSLRVGELPKEKADYKLTNVSFRLTSVPHVLEPREEIRNSYRMFAGPKRPALLVQYTGQPLTKVTLDDLVYYGWFGWVAKPMLRVLHFFYWMIPNFGIAIVMLTVLVRGAMFPVSRKQALGAQKMQELQPQIKALTEKYKNNPQERQRAQMELFRKHSYNPLAGCLPVFLQMPIFIGLYRSLMVDVELRDAPLISAAIRWCSNLAAPDMLYNWSSFMPDFVVRGQGFFGLGPYLNVLPLVTIGLFLWQQTMFMPPPTDEQTAMQQKMMKYMMIFMGFMFFKVASGLCLYFIASSLWGITERKLLPKTIPKGGVSPSAEKKGEIESAASTNGSGKSRKKQRN